MNLEEIGYLALFLAWIALFLMYILLYMKMKGLSREDKRKKAFIDELRAKLRSYGPVEPPVDRAKYKRTHHG